MFSPPHEGHYRGWGVSSAMTTRRRRPSTLGQGWIRPRLPFVLVFSPTGRGHDMKKALVAGLLSIILVLPGTAVQAGGYY